VASLKQQNKTPTPSTSIAGGPFPSIPKRSESGRQWEGAGAGDPGREKGLEMFPPSPTWSCNPLGQPWAILSSLNSPQSLPVTLENINVAGGLGVEISTYLFIYFNSLDFQSEYFNPDLPSPYLCLLGF